MRKKYLKEMKDASKVLSEGRKMNKTTSQLVGEVGRIMFMSNTFKSLGKGMQGFMDEIRDTEGVHFSHVNELQKNLLEFFIKATNTDHKTFVKIFEKFLKDVAKKS